MYMITEYGHSGKEYNGEKAIISLTSWKARIGTVGLTIFSLLKNCPGFHIVLVLSEDEFPRKDHELPTELRSMIQMNIIEVLWVGPNYTSFKKVLFTMDKYRVVPIISADDDCIYTSNYAKIMYDKWLMCGRGVVTDIVHTDGIFKWCCGASTLYSPHVFGDYALDNIGVRFNNNDDAFLAACMIKLNIPINYINKKLSNYSKFHTTIKALSEGGYNATADITRYLNLLPKVA